MENNKYEGKWDFRTCYTVLNWKKMQRTDYLQLQFTKISLIKNI